MIEVELILAPASIVPSPSGRFFLAAELQKCTHRRKPPSSPTLDSEEHEAEDYGLGCSLTCDVWPTVIDPVI